jgi:ATP synthase subunit 6
MKNPIDQFEVSIFFSLEIYKNIIDLTITNLTITYFIVLAFMLFFVYLIVPKKIKSLKNKIDENIVFVVPNRWQLLVEYIIVAIFQLIYDSFDCKTGAQKFVPFILSLFFFILLMNLVGLLPYSVSVTSHCVITFALSFSVFFGSLLIAVQKHELKVLHILIPADASVLVAVFLIPIELASYFSRPFSLGLRLFINLMAGHCLLKVIVGFSWKLLMISNFFGPFLHLIPVIALVLLIGLEIMVAFIQTYVFVVLTCIYLNDSDNLH